MKQGEFKNLEKLFNPASIAIVGASSDEKKIGNILVKNIEKSGYWGEVFLVNPKLPHLGAYRTFASYTDIPKIPELAIIATPAATILEILKTIGEKGTKNVVIFAAGFKEIGEEGARLEANLIRAAEKFKINILGPNCLGFVNTASRLNATFGQVGKEMGNVRFASQSGAVATSLFDWAAATGVGFKEFVTLGNKANVNENDVLNYWLRKPELGVKEKNEQKEKGLSPYAPIGLYLESINDGQQFVKVAGTLSKHQPIVALKPGKSSAARAAMQSHTGALAGDENILDAAFEECGVLRAEGVEDMFDLLRAFAWERAPLGNQIAIVSNAGGPAVITTDFLEGAGLTLAPIGKRAEEKLKNALPREAALHNPIDVLGDAPASRYEEALEALLSEKAVDGAIVILTPQVMTQIEETANIVVKLSKKFEKPILCSFMGGSLVALGEQILNDAKIPSFRFPERAVKAMGQMYRWSKWKATPLGSAKKVQGSISATSVSRIENFVNRVTAERKVLTGFETSEIFKEAGLNVPEFALVTSFADAKEFTHRFGFPVALKIMSPNFLHKTEVGGVVTNITSEEELAAEVHQMQKLALSLKSDGKSAGIMIQKFLKSGVEVIVGLKRDPSFGKVLLLGAGGVLIELLADRNISLLPANHDKISKLVKHTKVFKLLHGYRGKSPYAIGKLTDLILKFCELAEKVDVFSEIEINPVIVTHKEAYAVDGRAII